MTCQPTKTQPPEAIDFAALREKYRIEKEKRLRKEGQAQYQRPSGDFVPDYAVDPYKAVPRATRWMRRLTFWFWVPGGAVLKQAII